MGCRVPSPPTGPGMPPIGPCPHWKRDCGGISEPRILPNMSRPFHVAMHPSGGTLEMTFQRITIDQEQMGGVACIRGLRIPVATVMGMIAEGMSESEVLDAYPDMEIED